MKKQKCSKCGSIYDFDDRPWKPKKIVDGQKIISKIPDGTITIDAIDFTPVTMLENEERGEDE